MDVNRVRARIGELRGEFEDDWRRWSRCRRSAWIPGRRGEMDRCAASRADYLRAIGARVDVIDTGGFPLVVGRIVRDPSLPTVTIYNHLDVQPADATEWRTPPFTFTRDGDRWFARGSTDDKGPALTALYGARLALEEDARVNIQFLWELEEEIGSPNFEAGLAAAIAGDADARRLHHRLGRRVRHDLDRRGAAGDPLRPARAHGLHRGAADRRQGRALGDDRRRRAQPDRRAVRAHRPRATTRAPAA